MEMLRAKWDEGKFVCVGLDSELSKIPSFVTHHSQTPVITFNREIIEATRDIAGAYKPNIAFYASRGTEGIRDLVTTVGIIKAVAPSVPIILDAKRADIGNTNLGYVIEAFQMIDADAVTVNPYFGSEALLPFLGQKEKGVIVLCRTSNKGAAEFQNLVTESEFGKIPLYQVVAHSVAKKWNTAGNCALVFGATAPAELAIGRNIVGDDFPLLIPGIGKQGGDLEKTVNAGKDSAGRGMIINSSSGIIFASSGENFAEAARRETEKLHNDITEILKGAVAV